MATAKKTTAAKAAKPAAKAVAAETGAAADDAQEQRADQVKASSTAEADTTTAAADGGDQHDDQAGADDATTEATALADRGKATAADGDPTEARPAPAVDDAALVPAVSAAPASAPGVGLYRVLSNLEHDLVLYAPGSVLQLSDDQAAPLLGHTVTPHSDQDTDETAG